MAKHQGKVYLAYEEEAVSEKNQTLLHYTVNKIGGFPVSMMFSFNTFSFKDKNTGNL